MEQRASYGNRQRPPPPAGGASSPEARYGPEDFPGCESFHLPESELARFEGRIEFWDGRTQTAWRVCEPTTIWHEAPTRMLSRLAERFASLRGSRIECFGSADLVCRDAWGRPRWLMQADEVLYVHPERSRPQGSDIDIERDPLPDVALEVDNTTDVRRRKLAIYMDAGFPEVWVLVPPGSRRAGYPRATIHVRDGKGYRTAEESGAIPGYAKDEIFRALTERPWSEPTWHAVERVGRAMGEREGTRPEDDPLSRSLIREGEAKGRREERAAMVRELLLARSIVASPTFAEELARAGDVPADALTAAALACTNEADCLRRVRTFEPPVAALAPAHNRIEGP